MATLTVEEPQNDIELDHFILEVKDPLATLRFLHSTLGLAAVRLEEFESGKAPFPSARVTPGLVIDLFPQRLWRGRTPENPNHVCFRLSSEGLQRLRQRLDEMDIRVTKTDDHNFGARGWGRSLYFEGPDGLNIEARAY